MNLLYIARDIAYTRYKFKMIRYYGFLANRVRGKLLPIVNDLLGLTRNIVVRPISFIDLMKKSALKL